MSNVVIVRKCGVVGTLGDQCSLGEVKRGEPGQPKRTRGVPVEKHHAREECLECAGEGNGWSYAGNWVMTRSRGRRIEAG